MKKQETVGHQMPATIDKQGTCPSLNEKNMTLTLYLYLYSISTQNSEEPDHCFIYKNQMPIKNWKAIGEHLGISQRQIYRCRDQLKRDHLLDEYDNYYIIRKCGPCVVVPPCKIEASIEYIKHQNGDPLLLQIYNIFKHLDKMKMKVSTTDLLRLTGLSDKDSNRHAILACISHLDYNNYCKIGRVIETNQFGAQYSLFYVSDWCVNQIPTYITDMGRDAVLMIDENMVGQLNAPDG